MYQKYHQQRTAHVLSVLAMDTREAVIVGFVLAIAVSALLCAVYVLLEALSDR